MSFNIGLSGIRAASTDLEVTGNNIANASTIGFKMSRAEFGDVYTTTLLGTGNKPVGSGVQVENVRQQFSQGNISGTGNVLDMAIDGNGFFVLNDNGTTSYSRSGIFTLDKDGFVVTNNNARLQGFPANSNGEINGILGDIQISVSNQAPRLTNLVSAQYNLNAGAKVLQEQGKMLVAGGQASGAASSGILDSTTSVLSTQRQPTTGGVPARVNFATDLATVAAAGYGPMDIDIDLGTGAGLQTVSLLGVPAGSSVQDVLNDVQSAINDALDTQQLRAYANTTGELVLQRAGYNATNGSGFTLANTGSWDAVFGANTGVTGAVAGTPLFVGSNPISADFRNIPGTQTTTRTTATPPLNMVTHSTGSYSALVSSTLYGSLNLSAASGNALAFTIGTESGQTYSVNLQQAAWQGAAPGDFSNVNLSETVGEINAQLAVQAAPGTPQVQAVANAGRVEFHVVSPGVRGDYLQLAPNVASSANYSLDTFGFLSDNRFNAGAKPIAANNEFQIRVNSNTGHGSTIHTITIPPKNYASLDDLAIAIQQQIDLYIGSTGLSGKVSVEATGGQLVFSNLYTGSGESIDFLPSAGAPTALSALGFDSMFKVNGIDEIDRTNSFRLTLTVPAPDLEQRSGTVQISLDEEYRSVQQLAASINRQLNSQDSASYIGIQAAAVEVIPATTPPQFKLEFRATKGGEGSHISITDVNASGKDLTEADLFGILQANPGNQSLLSYGIEGVSNKYPEQRVTITDPKGNETQMVIPARSEANEIVAMFNMQPGFTANAETTMTIPLASYNSPGKNMTLTLNGQKLEATSLADIADEINSYRGTTLPGFSAQVDSNGNLVISNQIGRDIKISMQSSVVTDSLVIQGVAGTGPMVLGGSPTADRAGAVGGVVTLVLNENYSMSKPSPRVQGIFENLTDDEFENYTINAFDPLNQDTYNHSTSMTIYDSLGNPHVMTQYFVKEPQDPTRPNESNIWAMYVLIDGYEVGDPDPTLPFPENLEPTRFRKEVFFNQDGSLDAVATGDVFITNWDPLDSKGNPNGATSSKNILEGGLPLSDPPTNSNFQIVLKGSTQHNGAFDVNDQTQNGYSTGRLSGLEVDQAGIIFARFTNGQAQVLGQVALANFRNPEGLTPLGSTSWGESFESGTPTIGSPRTASFGQIKSSALEDSNVDLSEQLVRLIIAQRNFQASSKTIETMDKMTQTILNI
ncbi:MAG: flagellar hook-basal body complex protein [Venatoribacter sp.]